MNLKFLKSVDYERLFFIKNILKCVSKFNQVLVIQSKFLNCKIHNKFTNENFRVKK